MTETSMQMVMDFLFVSSLQGPKSKSKISTPFHKTTTESKISSTPTNAFWEFKITKQITSLILHLKL